MHFFSFYNLFILISIGKLKQKIKTRLGKWTVRTRYLLNIILKLLLSQTDQYDGIKKSTHGNWKVTEITDWVCDITYMRDIMFTLQAFPHFWRAKYTWEKTANFTCTHYIDNLISDSYNQVSQI